LQVITRTSSIYICVDNVVSFEDNDSAPKLTEMWNFAKQLRVTRKALARYMTKRFNYMKA